ncbi:hypothetical protein V6N12_046658 [Hibiscus sabdariffa]|uniref:RNase H type-1 domain-containing protein n=1 Tax=Hibiscus sabdariffa TaxID=183260 RepID=A0ABR2A5S2_9ROSI
MSKGFDGTSPPMRYVLFVASTRRIWIMFYVAARTLAIFSSELFLRLWGYQEDILIRGNRLLEECQHAFTTNSRPQLSVTVPQLWSRPPLGWVKVNVDASVSLAYGNAALGGVFRDENGYWIYGFACNTRQCYALHSELWAVHDCLSRAWSLSFRRLVIETDCLEVIRILKHSSNTWIDNNLIELILNWIRKDWQLVFRHVPHNINHVADREWLLWVVRRRGMDYRWRLHLQSCRCWSKRRKSIAHVNECYHRTGVLLQMWHILIYKGIQRIDSDSF